MLREHPGIQVDGDFLFAELVSKGATGVTLRDQDATNAKDGDWTKINTLGHYKLDEMVRGHKE